MVNHFYFYAVDRDFGPLFLKFGTYFPYTGKLCLNGHEYVNRQLAQRGIVYQALDNGILSCAAPTPLQALFSLTRVPDRPATGRTFFEEVIRENLDLGRPDQVQLIFDRRVSGRTPGRFRTRVITEGVTPSLHVDYKRTRIKQYHKEGARCGPRPRLTVPARLGPRDAGRRS